MADRIFGRECDGAIGADDRSVGAAPLQGGFGQQRPGAAIVRGAGEHLLAEPLSCREIAVSERALRRLDCRAAASICDTALQAAAPCVKAGLQARLSVILDEITMGQGRRETPPPARYQ